MSTKIRSLSLRRKIAARRQKQNNAEPEKTTRRDRLSSRAAARSGNSEPDDPIEARFQEGRRRVEALAQNLFIPLSLLGVAASTFLKECLGHRAYPIAGFLIGVFGVALSVESYWISLAGGRPFLPKIGVEDGADIRVLLDIFQGGFPIRLFFLVLLIMAIVVSLIESLPLRLRKERKRRTQGAGRVPLLVWALVAAGYGLEFYSVSQSYGSLGWSPAVLVWGLLTVFLAEMGIALNDLAKQSKQVKEGKK